MLRFRRHSASRVRMAGSLLARTRSIPPAPPKYGQAFVRGTCPNIRVAKTARVSFAAVLRERLIGTGCSTGSVSNRHPQLFKSTYSLVWTKFDAEIAWRFGSHCVQPLGPLYMLRHGAQGTGTCCGYSLLLKTAPAHPRQSVSRAAGQESVAGLSGHTHGAENSSGISRAYALYHGMHSASGCRGWGADCRCSAPSWSSSKPATTSG
ncbi:hypothetical protein V8D89_009939 [Ganoderma adspersum]